MGNKTALHAVHVQNSAKIVDFAGWDMPLHYGSQLNEHHQVRTAAGMFDVSHMGVVDIHGKDSFQFLQYLLANNVAKLQPGKALYTCMLNERGGVVDDLIVYQLQINHYRLVINAATKASDIQWMREKAENFQIELSPLDGYSILAVQGPLANSFINQSFSEHVDNLTQLKPFNFLMINDCMLAKTGYTGEAGFEIILPNDAAVKLWHDLQILGVKPCGLAARDTLRLEAGFNLYGHDMTENDSPLESNLAWTIAFEPPERQFIGRAALQQQITNELLKQKLVGLVLEGPGIIRDGAEIKVGENLHGKVTSGGYSPTLEKSIALARVDVGMQDHCKVLIRNKEVTAKIIKPPFVRNGKKMF